MKYLMSFFIKSYLKRLNKIIRRQTFSQSLINVVLQSWYT